MLFYVTIIYSRLQKTEEYYAYISRKGIK